MHCTVDWTTLSVQHFCGYSLTECGRTFHRSSHLWSFGQDLTPSTWSHSAEQSITTGCRTPSAAPGLLNRLSIGNTRFTARGHSLSDNQRSNNSLMNQNKRPSLVTTNQIDCLHKLRRTHPILTNLQHWSHTKLTRWLTYNYFASHDAYILDHVKAEDLTKITIVVTQNQSKVGSS